MPKSSTASFNSHSQPKPFSMLVLTRLVTYLSLLSPQGLISNPTVLDVGDVELVDLKLLDEEPIIVVQFSCQQIDCLKDKFGVVLEGSEDTVQRVYYWWALQQDTAGRVGPEGKVLPPRWQLKEMMVRGMHKLL